MVSMTPLYLCWHIIPVFYIDEYACDMPFTFMVSSSVSKIDKLNILEVLHVTICVEWCLMFLGFSTFWNLWDLDGSAVTAAWLDYPNIYSHTQFPP